MVVPREELMEEVLVSGVSSEREQAKITVCGVPDTPGLASSIFVPLAEAGVVIDMIVQNVGADGRTDMTFTVAAADLEKTEEIASRIAREVGALEVRAEGDVGKVSVVGLGMRNHAGVAARMFTVLASEGINIRMIATSEIKISVLIGADEVPRAVEVLHETFMSAEGRALAGMLD